MSEADVESVNALLKFLQAGDVKGAANQLADDVILDEMGSLPHSGTFHGREGFFKLMKRFGELYGGVALDDVSVHDAGAFVVAKLTGTFTSKNGEHKAVMPVIEHYTMRDGKVAHADVYYKDPNQFNAL
jgi:ketosteroid isomerase-like protein